MFDTNVIYESTRVESDRHLIPDDLESIPPGLILAAYLFRIDRSRLNGHDLVRVMKTDARLAAHFQARMFEGMAELATWAPDTWQGGQGQFRAVGLPDPGGPDLGRCRRAEPGTGPPPAYRFLANHASSTGANYGF